MGRLGGDLARKAGQRLTQPYDQWATGDGATTVFFLDHAPTRGSGLWVFVSGLKKRPADKGTANDYAVSGNWVTFVVAPAAAAPVCFTTLAV